MAKKKTSKAPSAPAVDRAAPCSPITDAVYPPEIIDREFLEQGRNFGWGTLRDMRECARKLEYENAAMRLAIAEFCKAQEWACDEWKRQSHIAPLFKLSNDQPEPLKTRLVRLGEE